MFSLSNQLIFIVTSMGVCSFTFYVHLGTFYVPATSCIATLVFSTCLLNTRELKEIKYKYIHSVHVSCACAVALPLFFGFNSNILYKTKLRQNTQIASRKQTLHKPQI